MIFGYLVGLKFPDICLTGEENPEKTSSRKLVPTVDRTRARCATGAHATAFSTTVDYFSQNTLTNANHGTSDVAYRLFREVK